MFYCLDLQYIYILKKYYKKTCKYLLLFTWILIILENNPFLGKALRAIFVYLNKKKSLNEFEKRTIYYI